MLLFALMMETGCSQLQCFLELVLVIVVLTIVNTNSCINYSMPNAVLHLPLKT